MLRGRAVNCFSSLCTSTNSSWQFPFDKRRIVSYHNQVLHWFGALLRKNKLSATTLLLLQQPYSPCHNAPMVNQPRELWGGKQTFPEESCGEQI